MYFRNETSPGMSPRITTESSHFAHNRSCRKSSRHQSFPVNEVYERSFHRCPNKRSYCLERESSPGHDYSHVHRSDRKGTSRHYKHRSPDQRSDRKRSTSRRNSRHYRTNKRSHRTPSRPHRHQESNSHSSSKYLSRTVKSNCSARFKSRHRNNKHVNSSRRHHSPETSSSSDDEDSSSSSSSYSSDDSDSLSESSSSDESAYSSSDNSPPERHQHSKSSRNHQKSKHPDRRCHKNYDKLDHRQDKSSLERHHHCQDPSIGHQHRQRRFPLTKQAERIYTDERGYTQEYVPRNQELIRYKATKKTVKVERDPSISDIIEQHLIFHQRCDNVELMLGQLLERSQQHPLIRHDDSQSLNWKGLCL